MCKKRIFTTTAAVIILACFSAQNAVALLVLPNSTFDSGKWQGFRNYSKDGFDVLVEFNVYDNDGGNEFLKTFGPNAKPGDGRYIYAYQVFNAREGSEDVGYFGLFGKNKAVAESTIIGQSSYSYNADPNSKGPSDKSFSNTTKEVYWEFKNSNIIKMGEYSWLLVFSSNNTPIVGDFRLEKQGEIPAPSDAAPEPATLGILAGGSFMIWHKRKIRQ